MSEMKRDQLDSRKMRSKRRNEGFAKSMTKREEEREDGRRLKWKWDE